MSTGRLWWRVGDVTDCVLECGFQDDLQDLLQEKYVILLVLHQKKRGLVYQFNSPASSF